jgi:hypothetical protein
MATFISIRVGTLALLTIAAAACGGSDDDFAPRTTAADLKAQRARQGLDAGKGNASAAEGRMRHAGAGAGMAHLLDSVQRTTLSTGTGQLAEAERDGCCPGISDAEVDAAVEAAAGALRHHRDPLVQLVDGDELARAAWAAEYLETR